MKKLQKTKEKKNYLLILIITLIVSSSISSVIFFKIKSVSFNLYKEKCDLIGGQYIYLENEDCPIKNAHPILDGKCFNYYCALSDGTRLNVFELVDGLELLTKHNYNLLPSGVLPEQSQ